MIPCSVVRRHADAVMDGEVDPTTQIEFDQHLADCGPCRIHLSFSRTLKARVREALTDGTPPASPELTDRIRRALDAEDARRSANSIPAGPEHQALLAGPDPALLAPAASGKKAPLGLTGVRFLPIKARYAVPAAAAAVALAVIAAREGGNPDSPQGLSLEANAVTPVNGTSYLEDVVDRHWRGHPAEVSGPPTQVASWFRGKLEFPVRPIEFGNPAVRFVGARLSSVRNREAAAFYYDVSGRRVTVLVFEPPASRGPVPVRGAMSARGPMPFQGAVHQTLVEGRGIYYGHARGYTVPVVQHQGLTYAITGDLDSRSVLRLAAHARVQN
jgi:putative zinc finger protein